MDTNYHKKAALDIYSEALKAVDPHRLTFHFSEKVRSLYQDSGAERLIVTGFGKAAITMGKAAEDSLYDIITEGILITKHGHRKKNLLFRKLKVFEAGHPIPDENGLTGTGEVIRLMHAADENTLVLCLISGGGSALLVSPYEGITLADKQNITDLLLKAGAIINELNTLRKHISKVKGGRLAEIAHPANVISLIISDVIGDRLDVIASGPTSPDDTTFQDALRVIEKYELMDQTPPPVLTVLRKGADGLIPETPKEGSYIFDRVENMIIGNNKKALEAAKAKADSFGLDAEIISAEMTGEAREVGKWLAQKAIKIKNSGGLKRSCCLISGGETTVTVKGNGLGGRNMELALAFAMEIDGIDGITLLSAGTDGTDGPTDAAGAILDGKTIEKGRRLGLDPQEYLNNNDSYHFFERINDLLLTGPTGTNVMDIQIIICG
ncbi:MAG: glycerate kinase [Nitrospiraceae bacterium]|nr:MAG: glycerate kinase [Nitrospiraceae bacterium]